MYESKTYDSILAAMMARVPDTLDKREGSVIYYALAPAAAELAQAYIELDVLYNETFADTASRENLIKRAAERGITPTPATYALMQGVFNMAVPIGSRYSQGSYIFAVVENLGSNNYSLRAETLGSGPNNAIGDLIPVSYIDGLTQAAIVVLLIPGEDEEDTEVLRTRYFDSFDSQEFGGNKADYKSRVNAITGVGGCKTVRTPGGGGTVGVTIIASDYSVPSGTLITTVQTALDPTVNSGEGDGLAPIGHMVTVTGVTETTINIASTITYAPGWNWTTLQPYATAMIDAYFLELKQTWQNEANLIVRIAQIESRYLDLPGVVDITATTLNGGTANIALGVNAIPKRGSVSG